MPYDNQDSLLDLLNKFSYKRDRRGVCYGFAHMGIKAILHNHSPKEGDGLLPCSKSILVDMITIIRINKTLSKLCNII